VIVASTSQYVTCGRRSRFSATWLTHLQLTTEQSDQANRLAERAALAAQRVAERNKILAGLGVTRAESALFTAIHYGWTVPPAELPSAAVMEDYSADGSVVSEEECRAALTACLAKGWLRVLDEPTLAGIVEELRRDGVLGPIYGFPMVGGVDFTPAGAALYHKLHQRPVGEPPFSYEDMVHNRFSQFFRSKQAALAAIEEHRRQDDTVAVVGPTPTGPWRAQWWRRFPEGSQVDIEQRMQWQGRCVGGGGHWGLYLGDVKPQLPKLQHILDRHNVAFAEWLFFFAMETESMRAAPKICCRRFVEV
jgi:hypothetical protein